MKQTTIAMLVGSFTLMTAQLFGQTDAPKPVPERRTIRNIYAPGEPTTPQPETTFESRKLATSDVRNIRLNAVFGNIEFTAAGIEYFYNPNAGSGESYSPATKTSACLALLPELRKSDTIVIRVAIRLPDMPSDRKQVEVSELTILIDKLK